MSLQGAELDLLLAKNRFDQLQETYRDKEIQALNADRYSMTDSEYSSKYLDIYNHYESKMYRAWLTK